MEDRRRDLLGRAQALERDALDDALRARRQDDGVDLAGTDRVGADVEVSKVVEPSCATGAFQQIFPEGCLSPTIRLLFVVLYNQGEKMERIQQYY